MLDGYTVTPTKTEKTKEIEKQIDKDKKTKNGKDYSINLWSNFELKNGKDKMSNKLRLANSGLAAFKNKSFKIFFCG